MRILIGRGEFFPMRLTNNLALSSTRRTCISSYVHGTLAQKVKSLTLESQTRNLTSSHGIDMSNEYHIIIPHDLSTWTRICHERSCKWYKNQIHISTYTINISFVHQGIEITQDPILARNSTEILVYDEASTSNKYHSWYLKYQLHITQNSL